MDFEWDEAKRKANLAKHGLDFANAVQFGWETASVTLDDRFDYGEEREIALGLYGMDVHVVIYTPRGPRKRLISFRKATRREAEKYYEEEKDRS
ncbi:MAG TPA: BrnT family toxin [Rhizomicrobium sp.]|nr:BrnT family toxin [Rhizomicrobium sp.]